ncbi:hypothetical protein C0Q70_00638 [Pomacea canaliculata]|uniref:Uncharacterized protein n=1 Tax=Pomacea canaliculata TaxID=400727 RepID=A0A2T7PX71_POMCA|nr:hypothetical protein C0Q70_00638 [Pomacea canaliculata]
MPDVLSEFAESCRSSATSPTSGAERTESRPLCSSDRPQRDDSRLEDPLTTRSIPYLKQVKNKPMVVSDVTAVVSGIGVTVTYADIISVMSEKPPTRATLESWIVMA